MTGKPSIRSSCRHSSEGPVHSGRNAIANFTDEVNQIKGGTSESLFIAMTVDTLTEFPNIKRVEFRAEGKPLQFQMDMTKQFMRDESYIQQTKT